MQASRCKNFRYVYLCGSSFITFSSIKLFHNRDRTADLFYKKTAYCTSTAHTHKNTKTFSLQLHFQSNQILNGGLCERPRKSRLEANYYAQCRNYYFATKKLQKDLTLTRTIGNNLAFYARYPMTSKYIKLQCANTLSRELFIWLGI